VELTFHVVAGPARGEQIEIAPAQVILGGYSARSAEERDRHIAELRTIGIEPPARVPAFWHVARHLLTTDDSIEVQGDRTSGEAEFALIVHGGRIYVTVASDQTDRELERVSIPRSKQLCPKVLGSEVIPLDEMRARWDEFELSSDVSADGTTWVPYQRSPLSALLGPATLIQAAGLADDPPDGSILLCGTIPLVDGVTRFLHHFRAALGVPGGGLPTLRIAYRVSVLPELVPTPPEVRA
jgi:hypothetical protein